jgi:hypothetical protein
MGQNTGISLHGWIMHTTSSGTKTIGAAFYGAMEDKAFTINPSGNKETKTTPRRKLGGIYGALKHVHTSHPRTPALTILTDSMASIIIIQRMLRNPHTLTECKHYLLLQDISELIMQRIDIKSSTAI